MGKVTAVGVNITEIKYDNASKSLSIDRGEQSRWKVLCEDVINLVEKTEDVAPYFLCHFLDRRDEGYAILKGIKVFTVFIEHEGVMHLRKYDNLIKKIKSFLPRIGKSAILIDDVDEVKEEEEDGKEGAPDSEGAKQILEDAGIYYEHGTLDDSTLLAHLKKPEFDEVITLRPIDLPDDEREDVVVHDDDAERERETNRGCSAEKADLKEKEPSEDGNSSLSPTDEGFQENGDEAMAPSVSDMNVYGECHRDDKDGAIVTSNMNGSVAGAAAAAADSDNDNDAEDVSPLSKESFDTKCDRDTSKGEEVSPKHNYVFLDGDDSRSKSSSSKSWPCNFYLISAALIAIIAISIHLSRAVVDDSNEPTLESPTWSFYFLSAALIAIIAISLHLFRAVADV